MQWIVGLPARLAGAPAHAGLSRHLRRHARARHRRGGRDVQRRQHGHAAAAPVPRLRSPRRARRARRPGRTSPSASVSARSSTCTTRSARSSSTASSSSAPAPRRCARTNRVERIPMAFPTNDMYATLGVRPQLGRLPVPEDGDRRRRHQRPALEQLVRPRSRRSSASAYFVSDEHEAGHRRHAAGVPASRATTRCSGSPSEIRLSRDSPGPVRRCRVVARMKPGVTREQLAAELTRLSKELPARFGGTPTTRGSSSSTARSSTRCSTASSVRRPARRSGCCSAPCRSCCSSRAPTSRTCSWCAPRPPTRPGRASRDRRVARAARPASDGRSVRGRARWPACWPSS